MFYNPKKTLIAQLIFIIDNLFTFLSKSAVLAVFSIFLLFTYIHATKAWSYNLLRAAFTLSVINLFVINAL